MNGRSPCNPAGIERATGHLDLAMDAYSRALEHLRRVLPSISNLLRRYYVPADVSAAISEEEAALIGSDGEVSDDSGVLKVLGENGVLDSAASVLNNLGLLMKSKGEPRCAYRLYLRAVSLGTIALGEHHPTIALRIRNLGAVLLGLGHSEMATERLQQAHGMCALGYGEDHPETTACADWLSAAREGSGAGSLAQEEAAAAALPDVAEWFTRELDCGVLEPPQPPPLPGDKDDSGGAVAAAPAAPAAHAADPPPTTEALPPPQLSARGGGDDLPLVPAVQRIPPQPQPLALALAPLEPGAGEDLLSPYSQPQTAVVGGDGGAPVWASVAEERADIVHNSTVGCLHVVNYTVLTPRGLKGALPGGFKQLTK